MRHRSRFTGFTLIEILTVVIILGILAAIVIPQYTQATQGAKDNSTYEALQSARRQIELFRFQHADTPPAQTNLWTVMCTQSNTTDFSVGAAGGALGPYFGKTPINPEVNLTAFTTGTGTTYGWQYTTGANKAYSLKALDVYGNAMTY